MTKRREGASAALVRIFIVVIDLGDAMLTFALDLHSDAIKGDAARPLADEFNVAVVFLTLFDLITLPFADASFELPIPHVIFLGRSPSQRQRLADLGRSAGAPRWCRARKMTRSAEESRP